MDSATVAKGSFLALSLPVILSACQRSQQALEQGAGFRVFEADEAADLTAIAARIIPTDDTPGATEAGVIYFLDTIFAEARRASQLASLREGLGALRGQLTTGGRPIHELTEAQQDQLLRDNEQTPFFATMRYLTIAGTFSLPRYGGNRGKVGYQLIGYEDRGAWSAPYGFYDADYAERGE
jgi:gluconate 2-dehydrogenase gamma chain